MDLKEAVSIIDWTNRWTKRQSDRPVDDKVKGKAVPLQVWTGPEGSRRLRPQDFKTVGT